MAPMTKDRKQKTEDGGQRTAPSAIRRPSSGSSLALVVISLTILTATGLGLLTIGYGARHQAAVIKGNLGALLAAEAGYEKAVFWMSQQQDMLNALQQGRAGTTGTLTFPDTSCTYQISLFSFAGSRPIFRVLSHGYSGLFERDVDVLVLQAASGWDMGTCQCAGGTNSMTGVYYVTGETIDMPIWINKANDSPDGRDIFISGLPAFLQPVTMGEPRLTAGGSDKYTDVMSLFRGGIYFDQPASRMTDESAVQTKITRFLNNTKSTYRLTPNAGASVTNRQPAVQLEFFVEGGVGKVRITNNCTMRGFQQSSDSQTYDFKIRPGSNGTQFDRYYIYTYHMAANNADSNGDRRTVAVTDTYVSQTFGSVQSDAGGQIFVNGNVIVGGTNTSPDGDQCDKGKITVVATGNIWIADAVKVDGDHDAIGMPTADNPNALGLVAQGVIKVVDPGLSDIDGVVSVSNYKYAPVCNADFAGATPGQSNYYQRNLSDPMIVEASLTVCGGGWGAENVLRGTSGGRKEHLGLQDYLEVHGAITEAVRGVVGVPGLDGFLKTYRMDRRLLTGILPGDIFLRGKYVPAPAGWRDYRPGS
jgi:hypothetical protein